VFEMKCRRTDAVGRQYARRSDDERRHREQTMMLSVHCRDLKRFMQRGGTEPYGEEPDHRSRVAAPQASSA
jgi:hypothetical protein